MGDLGNRTEGILRGIARVMSILIIAFALFMFLGHLIYPDTEPGSYPPIENLMPVLMLLSVLSLGLAWRWERLGGALCLVFFALVLALYWAINGYFFPLRGLLVFSPLVMTALLFLYLGWASHRAQSTGADGGPIHAS